MKENINWVGNRVLDPAAQRQPSMNQNKEQSPTVISPSAPMTGKMPSMGSQMSPMSQTPPMIQTPPMTQMSPMTQNPPMAQMSPITQMPPMTTQMAPPSQSDYGELSPMMDQEGPPTLTQKYYVPAYLNSLIGKGVRAEFVLGNNLYLDKTGILREVGVNYFVLEDFISRNRIMCDLYSVRFVTTV